MNQNGVYEDVISDICGKYIQLWKWMKYSNAEYIVIWSQHSTLSHMWLEYAVKCL